MKNELNQIHLFINDDIYYFIDIDKKTVIKEFNISDFLIELYESDNTSFNHYLEFILNNDSESLFKILGEPLSRIGKIECHFFNIKIDDDFQKPLEIYSFESYNDFVLFTIYIATSLNIQFNKCKNCGKYFVPTAKSNEIYCTRIYKNNRTCRDIGYENAVKSDEITKTYRNAYKTQNAKKQRNKDVPNIDTMFFDWASSAKEMYKLCKDNKIKLKQFSKWLQDHQNWIKD